jgi:hypothetical protein
VNDLVKYFKKHATGDVEGTLSVALEGNVAGVQERLNELTQAAAAAMQTRESAAARDTDPARDVSDVSDGARVDTDAHTSELSDVRVDSSPITGFTGGPFDGSSKSVPGLAKRVAIFYNARPTAVSLYWVDFDGREVHYVDVHPQHQGIVKTFQMHIWIVREMDSSRFVAQYTVGDEDTSTQSFTIPTS